MTSLLSATAPTETPCADDALDAVASQVRGILRHATAARRADERRSEERHPYPQPIYLTPLGPRGAASPEETVVVLGKHLSDHGLGFYSSQPLLSRRMIASLESSPGRWIGLEIELLWCRFTQHGWYDNGARILDLKESPLVEGGPRIAVRG